MEKETGKEIKKLLNVLSRMARTARINQWTGVREAADNYSIDQYNRILERLQELEPTGAKDLFARLPEDATWGLLSNASRDLAAYYEEDSIGKRNGGHMSSDPKRGIFIDKTAFWRGMPEEASELGNFIREKIAEWQDLKRAKE